MIKGSHQTEEAKKKSSLSHLGKKQSPETIEKRVSQLRGKKRNPEVMERLRQSNIGRKNTEESKKNMSNGQKGHKQSKETTEKILATKRAKGNVGMQGKHHTEKTKQQIREAQIGLPSANKGKKRTPEQIKEMSKIRKGKTHSEQHNKKISERLKGRIFSEEHKSNLKKMWKNPEYVKKVTASKSQFSNNQNENRMKDILLSLEIKFETQKRMNIPHSYLCDFYLPEYNCIIEADGSLYHAHPDRFKENDIIPFLKCTAKEKRELDATRTRELQEAGYKVLRFWENEFDEEIVKSKLLEVN